MFQFAHLFIVKIRIPYQVKPEFKRMRGKWGTTILELNKALTAVAIDELKQYLQLCHPDLDNELSLCQSVSEILKLISISKCSLTDISSLENIIEHFNIEKAKDPIQKYKSDVQTFCESLPLRLCLGEQLSQPSFLQCETATFIVHQSVDEVTLKDIDDLVTFVFENKARITVIQETNSFIITCSFSLPLTDSLIASAHKNIELLKEMGVYQLTIGFCTILDITEAPSPQVMYHTRIKFE